MTFDENITFPKITNPRTTERDGRTFIFDEIRRMWVVLTPEEEVRRLLVAFLINYRGALPSSIVEEYPIPLNSMAQRADVVVMDGNARPLLLAECKSTKIDFNNPTTLQEVFLQVTRYNAVLGARYIVLTNGIFHYCYERTNEGYQPLTEYPYLG